MTILKYTRTRIEVKTTNGFLHRLPCSNIIILGIPNILNKGGSDHGTV